ncbi:hypothetical protein [Mycobacterium simiae]|uniref:hypothetical protein n=1 Tax=Mycobacterium simiae TaxID=1784 RepID=UPI00041E3194|nr:hypothetical protein [Mycobacterium simiae]PLV48992.1 hypothetical protein X011_15985 [Mycobacterium tuberculosis variant microti OV254]
MNLGLVNATATVAGGSRDMGVATARCLAEDGARLALVNVVSPAAARRSAE